MKYSVKEWPEDFEEDLRTTALPTTDLAADLTTQVCLSVRLFVILSVYLFVCHLFARANSKYFFLTFK